MDEQEFKTRAGRIEQIGKVLEKLPAEIRSDAFDLLKDYVIESSAKSRIKKRDPDTRHEVEATSEEEFFGAFNHDKPKDNAKLIAAYFYREYGTEPFSLEEVQQKANHVGITIPARVDMTFYSAKKKGKSLFVREGRGKFKPTVHGEASLKGAYNVKKGTKKRAGDVE